MKKYVSLLLTATLALSSASVAFADEAVEIETNEAADIVEVAKEAEDIVNEQAKEEARDAAVAEAESLVDLEIMASVDSITMENVASGVTEKRRIVRVKYDKKRFTNGILSFTVNIKLPSVGIDSVASKSGLGVSLNDDFDSFKGIYNCSLTSEKAVASSDGTLFTMTIDFTNNLADDMILSLTGGTVISDGVITDSIDDKSMNVATVVLPKSTNEGNVLKCKNTGDTDNGFHWNFDGTSTLTITGHGNMDSYDEGAAPWYGENVIKHIIIKDDDGEFVTSIGQYVFAGLKNLEDFTIPDNVLTIGKGAFKGCESLKDVTFKSKLGSIGDEAFSGCISFNQIIVPDNVESIGKGAFEGCNNVSAIQIPFVGNQQGVTDTTEVKFSHIFNDNLPTRLTTVKVTNDTEIGSSAFQGCNRLQTININEGVKSIGVSAFEGCSALKEFYVPKNTTAINDCVFKGCSSATKIVLHNGITSIGASAFEGCSMLKDIDITGENVIPTYVTTLSDSVFKNCSALDKLVINNVTTIGSAILEGCEKLKTLTIPFVGRTNEITNFNGWAFEQSFSYLFTTSDKATQSNQSAVVPGSVTKVIVLNNGKNDGIAPYAFYGCANLIDIDVRGGGRIYNSAFEECRALKTLYLPKSITEIQSSILAGARNLQTLTVPFIGSRKGDNNKAESVLGYFFGYGTSQKYNEDVTQEYAPGQTDLYYYIPASLQNVVVLGQTTIPHGAFSYCTNLETVAITAAAEMSERAFYDCNNLISIKLPNDMKKISTEAFADCDGLVTINIPAKVSEIGSKAFYLDENLTKVIIPDSVSIIDDDTFNGAGSNVHSDMSVMSDGLTIVGTSNNEYLKSYSQGHNINFQVASEAEVEAVTPTIIVDKQSDGVTNMTVVADEDGTAYVAVYDSNGVMLAAKAVAKAEDDKAAVQFSTDEMKGATKAKAFIWNGMQNLTNVAEKLL